MSDPRASKRAKKEKAPKMSKKEGKQKQKQKQKQQPEEDIDQLWGADEPELFDSNDESDNQAEDEGLAGEEEIDEQQQQPSSSTSASTSATEPQEKTYLPGDEMPENTELTFDPSAYVTYNEWNTGWPCLSFDILPDSLGNNRQTFPMVSHLVGGTQTEDQSPCEILVMKVSNITQIKNNSMDEDDEESDDDDDNTPPNLQLQGIKHHSSVNRIKSCPSPGNIVATWSEQGSVNIWDVSKQVTALEKNQKNERSIDQKSIFTRQSKSEGFGLAWSSVVPYRLASGDNDGEMRIFDRQQDGQWLVKPEACVGHTGSIEDIAWSPNEPHVLSSCSADGTIKVWDVRQKHRCAITVKAHDCDVNALSWNRCEQHLMVSGADDGSFRVWDLRTFMSAATGKAVEPVADFSWHKGPITSVEWHPTDASVISCSGEDNQVTIWDLAVEQDLEAEKSSREERDVPPQLLFIHQGQTNVKEARWHRQLPGVIISTAENGFNLFKTISVTQ